MCPGQRALALHDAAPDVHLPAGATADTPLVQSGTYTVEVGGHTASVNLMVAGRKLWGFTGCEAENCPPNLRLADGTPATEGPATGSESGVGMLSVRFDAPAARWVLFGAYSQKGLPFDFEAAIRSAPFAAAVSADVQDLTQLS